MAAMRLSAAALDSPPRKAGPLTASQNTAPQPVVVLRCTEKVNIQNNMSRSAIEFKG